MSAKNYVTPEKTKHHCQILANRLCNRYAHLRKRFARNQIECFRLYDWDIPEVRAVVDWYAGHLVVGEYVRLQTGPEWLPQIAAAAGEALGVPPEKIHIKRRRTNAEGQPRYRKMGAGGERFPVNERNLRFWVNMDDFLDTGLYSDHRDTRVLLAKEALDKDFLNLYAYTGAFTCAVAAAGARTAVTVDRSATYLKWARENLELNGLWDARHTLVQSDADTFLAKMARQKQRFTLAFVDPPSFFRDRSSGKIFDINRDHPELLRRVLNVMVPGAAVFFSTNHQRFAPQFAGLPAISLEELTPGTIPEDFRNRKIHRCWRMTAS